MQQTPQWLKSLINILRHQTRLLFDFQQFDERRYEYTGHDKSLQRDAINLYKETR